MAARCRVGVPSLRLEGIGEHMRAVGRAVVVVLNALMVLGGVFLVFVGVVALSVSNDPEMGGLAAALGLLSLVVGLPLMIGGGVWWRRRLRRSETPADASPEQCASGDDLRRLDL